MANFEAKEPCVVCHKFGKGLVCYHHLWTRKARPEFSMVKFNMIPVCQEHHNEFHNKGTSEMAEKYPQVKEWLRQNNWIKLQNKWTRDFAGAEP